MGNLKTCGLRYSIDWGKDHIIMSFSKVTQQVEGQRSVEIK